MGWAKSPHTLVVLDDTPAGTEAIYDVPVITRWDEPTLRRELQKAPPCFFVLTNSRALPEADTIALHRALGRALTRAAKAVAQRISIVSRSDSTLRGHFPAETDVLDAVAGPFDATLLMPYFEAGARHTVDDVHYVVEGRRWIPVAETPFARDTRFGYAHSNLRSWVEEKTRGRIAAHDVCAITLADIRAGGPAVVRARLRQLPRGCVCIVNACCPRDAEVLALASQQAERAGGRFLYRTATSFVAGRLGLPPRPLLASHELCRPGRGGLIVVGSHSPKTTAQLSCLRRRRAFHLVEIPVPDLFETKRRNDVVRTAAMDIEKALGDGADVVLASSRRVMTANEPDRTLALRRTVLDALVKIVHRLRTCPRFLVAKGGVTSSDLVIRALGVQRALVRGQIIPGVPVWNLGPEAKFPGIDYVVFPGHVGDDDALATVVAKLLPPHAIA